MFLVSISLVMVPLGHAGLMICGCLVPRSWGMEFFTFTVLILSAVRMEARQEGRTTGIRLLYVANFFRTSGSVSAYCSELSEHLKVEGVAVRTCSHLRKRALRLGHMISTTLLTRSWYQVLMVDVFSGPAFRWASWVVFVGALMGRPVVTVLHGGNLPMYSKRNSRRVQYLFSRCQAVVAPSTYLQVQLGWIRQDITVIPNAINIARYPFTLRPVAASGLLWLRSFDSLYNPQLIPKVVAELVRYYPETRVTMAGPDLQDGSLGETKRLARELGVEDRIVFLGPVSKERIPEFMRTFCIYLNTPHIDNTPVTVLEAMACGLNIVSTNVGGIPYLLSHRKNALLAPDDDPTGMAAEIRTLLEDASLAECTAKAARKKVEEFDWNAVMPLWEDLLKRCAS